jgi:hypothetical protein
MMNRNNPEGQHRSGHDGERSERRYRGESAQWDDESSEYGREERPWRARDDERSGRSRRHEYESERGADERGGNYGGGRRAWGGGWSGARRAGAYGERERERDPGRDFGSEGYGVESDEYERRPGRGYGGRGYGAQSWTQRGFGGQGYEGRGYEGRGSGDRRARGEQGAYGFGHEGAGSAAGRGWGSYDESGKYGGRYESERYGARDDWRRGGNESAPGDRWARGDLTGGDADFLEERRRQTQGRFAGRGPKDYERSDQRIREDVCDRLMQDPEIDATGLTVNVQGGEVTLEGTVDSKNAKRLAEDVAEDVPGVREVNNRLRVDREFGRSSSRSTRSSGLTEHAASGSDIGAPGNAGGNTPPTAGAGSTATGGTSTGTKKS